jgi:hypothetical protein
MTGYGIALSKGSIYKEMLNRKILEYSFSGELERSHKFWFSGVCKNKQDESKGSHPLGFLNFTSAFLLLATGICISLIMLIVKIVLKRTCKKSFFLEKHKSEIIVENVQKLIKDEEKNHELTIVELKRELRNLKMKYNELEHYLIDTHINQPRERKGILKNNFQNSTDSEKNKRLIEFETLL